jgi:light-regulated signal transduction histidine kinase (bacteriophytochrome)
MSRKDLDRTPIDMMAMFRSVAEELTPAMADVPSLKLTIDPLPAANGDLGMIRQVAVNLVANALKFSRTRRTPCIEVGSFTGGDGRPVYYVQDNGVGFDMKHAHKLFNVFQRLHSADQFEGTGVGLAIVHRILARHGGRVWADAQPGRGATFFFTW